MATNTWSGARAIFRVEDKVVAFGGGVSGQEEIMYEPVDCLDSLATVEYVPVGYRVSFTCQVFRTVAGVKATGPNSTNGPTQPKQGQVGSIKKPAIGIMPRITGDISEILTNGWLTATLTDRLTNQTLYRFEECKAQGHNFDVQPRGIVALNLSFNCIRLIDSDSQ